MITYTGYTSLLKEGDNQQIEKTDCDLLYDHKKLRMEFDKTSYQLVSQICVSKCTNGYPMYGVNAVWDTGSIISYISEKVARKLGLSPVDSWIWDDATEQVNINYYEVDVQISDDIVLPRVGVAGFPMENYDVDFLIGMDIITKGDFSIRHEDDRMIFEFNT